jgi:hypothetical protein
MEYKSIIEQRGLVFFPEFTGERVYMRPFLKEKGLPKDLSRWQGTVNAMLDGIETDKPIYIMIDQTKVKKKNPHRRPGVHIDGYWGPSSKQQIEGHRGSRHIPIPTPRHNGGGSHQHGASSWADADFKEPEAIILASNIPGCKGYTGVFEGPVGEGGDCEHVDLSNMTSFVMRPNIVYAGNVCCLHESIPMDEERERTLVRLNVPGWTPCGM